MKKTTRRRLASPPERGLRLSPDTIRTLSSHELTHAIAGNKQVTICDTTSLTTENNPSSACK
jgi:hypothetical protein